MSTGGLVDHNGEPRHLFRCTATVRNSWLWTPHGTIGFT